MKTNESIVLEESTNTHVIKNSNVVEVIAELPTMTTIVLKVVEPDTSVIIEHGHHHTVATEKTTNHVIKITQQEFNPIVRAFQNSFD